MRLGEIVDQLEDLRAELGDDADVRLAFQPSWPLQFDVADVVIDDLTNIVYIAEGGSVVDDPYVPEIVQEELGWRGFRR